MGRILVSSVVPVLDTAVYATGDVMHTTAMAFRVFNQSGPRIGKLVQAVIADAGLQGIAAELVLFSSEPAATTYGALNAAFAPTAAQQLTICGVVAFGTTAATQYFAYSGGAVHIATNTNPICVYSSSASTPQFIYGVLVAKGAWDAVAANDIQVTLSVEESDIG